ncbi:uncharacterized protein LOC141662270 [Apium graveolens]|uniref:uncharacterized protein LOC141662270 n=1 Tax=Apium graveolens TaxID=4045 RepID=UPI003D78D8FE
MDDENPWHLFCSEDMVAGGKRVQKLKKLSRLRNGGVLMDTFEPDNDDFCYRCDPLIDAPTLNKEVAGDIIGAHSFDDKGPGEYDSLIFPPTLNKGVASDTIDARDFDDTSLSPLLGKGKSSCSGLNKGARGGTNVVDQSMWSEDFEGSNYDGCCSDSLGEYDYIISEDSDIDMDSFTHVRQTSCGKRAIPEEYASLRAPSAVCKYYSARMWKEERDNKNVTKGPPVFSLCCMKGAVSLHVVPPIPPYMMDLYIDRTRGPAFHRLIRLYNVMFAFTSSGGIIDHSINSDQTPYVYRLNGKNHCVFGSLIPNDDGTPKFYQLYVYDTVNEVKNFLHWVTGEDKNTVDAGVVQGLITMLDETNELVGKFKQQRDRYESNEIVDLGITLKVIRSESGRQTHFSSTDEVAGIMVGDTDETCGERDIVVDDKITCLLRISYVHPKLMALQYPILFFWGEDGYHTEIRFQKSADSSSKFRGCISLKDYYSYSFQVRQHDGIYQLLTRLWWFRTHQTTIRNELYNYIYDSVRRGDVDTSNIGKGIILPAGFVCSKRYMHQNFQDALAVCRYVGHPNIFLTMTANPLWDEI